MNTWIKLGFLNESDNDFAQYNKDIGIYKAILDEKIVYIGKATELNNGGFRKRLRDYTRDSDSGRDYPAGRYMYNYKEEIVIEIILMNRTDQGISEAEQLEKSLILELDPIWNKKL